MNVITHGLFGWGVATLLPGLSRREKTWIFASAIAPDLDGLGLLVEVPTRNSNAPLLWWSQYHHLLAHNLLFAVFLSFAAAAITSRALLAAAVFGSVNLHFLCDLAGSRGPDGYQWPLYYLWPFSERPGLTVSWQWALNAWPNLAISVLLLCYAFWFAYRSGSSPLELISLRANDRFVATLRDRLRLRHLSRGREKVTFDEDRVLRAMPDGRTESIDWEDLEEVSIVTTDLGPFVDDVFWVLLGQRDRCVAPSEAEGTEELTARLQGLPGFDNEAFTAAMRSTSNKKFVCWRRRP